MLSTNPPSGTGLLDPTIAIHKRIDNGIKYSDPSHARRTACHHAPDIPSDVLSNHDACLYRHHFDGAYPQVEILQALRSSQSIEPNSVGDLLFGLAHGERLHAKLAMGHKLDGEWRRRRQVSDTSCSLAPVPLAREVVERKGSIQSNRSSDTLCSHSLCTPQAVLVHIGSLLNSVCVSALAVHTAHCMIHDKLVARDAYFALALLGLIVVAAPLAIAAGTAMWGNSGFWVLPSNGLNGLMSMLTCSQCQLSPKYLTFRFLLLYLPLSLAILFTTVNYARLRSYLWHTNEDMVRSVVGKERRDTVRSYRQEAKRNAKRLRILILYPLLYILTVIVEASARGFGWANEVLESQKHAEKDALDAQDWALLVGGCFLASKGAVDVLLYTMTRDIFHISADPEEQRVTSSSYASVELPEMRDEEVQHWAQQRGIDIPSGSWEETWEHPQLTPAQEGEETNRGRAPRR